MACNVNEKVVLRSELLGEVDSVLNINSLRKSLGDWVFLIGGCGFVYLLCSNQPLPSRGSSLQ
jgi:hypothetical protein